MNGMTYTPGNDPTTRKVLQPHAKSETNFIYSISGNVISIIDLNLGNRSVTNDIENVLRKIEHYHQAPIGGFHFIYRDYLPYAIGAGSLRAIENLFANFLVYYTSLI